MNYVPKWVLDKFAPEKPLEPEEKEGKVVHYDGSCRYVIDIVKDNDNQEAAIKRGVRRETLYARALKKKTKVKMPNGHILYSSWYRNPKW